MHGEMLTEDIDSALRAVQKNVKAVHETNAISYELAPSEFQGFWKQRLRWAQGWAQASIVHMPMVWNKPEQGTRSFTKRFGVFSLLAVREVSYYLITQVCAITSSDFQPELTILILVHLPCPEFHYSQFSENTPCFRAYDILPIPTVGVVLRHQVSHHLAK
jgi:cellulose synthase/poly-beta-1,6-N-acetylglucosamine synthase-like glycosyltransferase